MLLFFFKKGQGEVDSILDDEVEKTVPFIEDTLDAETVAKNNISIFNDEGDPQKSWWKPQFWRATVAYPALVARSISVISLLNGAKLFKLQKFWVVFSNQNKKIGKQIP